ncbi:YihY/virulence factor BrkB family protein [Edaphobacter sp. 12200R-103]|jgi:YihY family inner membrane protein|uniref:YihY/virulence factor BrkB family protein n=1 Tax=Edaphobacter sp. 12200R-103 TaxID=2703788 RepID=UPI00138BFF6F|nr:YihY/virulence factor BrkB family protein [Edaphobacter sp. 12200R-103]QHS50533.1 YihY/virulence factor BrkB family protein [Edaphobacter sp. 12200R-103]
MFSIRPPRSETVRNDPKLAEPARTERQETASAVPIEEVPSVVCGSGFWSQFGALLKYMARTEVHTYAFSVAANAILSLFPFIVLLLTLCRTVFHSRAMEMVVGDMMRGFLPVGQDFVMRNMQLLAHPGKGVQFFSLVMLLVSSTGVFLPLEVALNSVWGVTKNRSYLRNQIVSLGLAFAVGILALASVASTSGSKSVLAVLFFGHTQNAAYAFFAQWFMKICGIGLSILLFFLIYWILPNRRIPAGAVIPTALIVGLLWELAKYLYIRALPWLDFQSVYGPFYISVGLMMWAFLSGLLVLAGAHVSATRYALRLTRQARAKERLAEQNEAKKEKDADR